jgi:hypothetical protein
VHLFLLYTNLRRNFRKIIFSFSTFFISRYGSRTTRRWCWLSQLNSKFESSFKKKKKKKKIEWSSIDRKLNLNPSRSIRETFDFNLICKLFGRTEQKTVSCSAHLRCTAKYVEWFVYTVIVKFNQCSQN